MNGDFARRMPTAARTLLETCRFGVSGACLKEMIRVWVWRPFTCKFDRLTPAHSSQKVPHFFDPFVSSIFPKTYCAGALDRAAKALSELPKGQDLRLAFQQLSRCIGRTAWPAFLSSKNEKWCNFYEVLKMLALLVLCSTMSLGGFAGLRPGFLEDLDAAKLLPAGHLHSTGLKP